jgi:hypothetical protein
MPDKPTENALVTELAHHLVYPSDNAELWKEMLSEKCPPFRTLKERISDIAWAGMKAGVSEPLALLVTLRYANSENAALTAEHVAVIVSRPYAFKKKMEEEEKAKNAAGTPPVPKKQ